MELSATIRYGRIDAYTVYKYTYVDGISDMGIQRVIRRVKRNRIMVEAVDKFLYTTSPVDIPQLVYCSTIKRSAPFDNTALMSRWLRTAFVSEYENRVVYRRGKATINLHVERYGPFTLIHYLFIHVHSFETGQYFVCTRPRCEVNFHGDDPTFGVEEALDVNLQVDPKALDIIVRQLRMSGTGSKIDINLLASTITAAGLENTIPCSIAVQSEVCNLLGLDLAKLRLSSVSKCFQTVEPVMSALSVQWGQLHDQTFLSRSGVTFSSPGCLRIGKGMVVGQLKAAYYNGLLNGLPSRLITVCLFGHYSDWDCKQFVKLTIAYLGIHPSNIRFESIVYSKSQDNYRLRAEANPHSSDFLIFVAPRQIGDREYKFLKSFDLPYYLHVSSKIDVTTGDFLYGIARKWGVLTHSLKLPQTGSNVYFLGIDLGHSAIDRYSNTVFTWFDYQGVYLGDYKTSGLLNESLDYTAIAGCFDWAKHNIRTCTGEHKAHIIVHRDGRLHRYDTDRLSMLAWTMLGVENVDVLEVIKSRYPCIARVRNGSLSSPQSGDALLFAALRFALLVTSDNKSMALDSSVVNPIIVRHGYGRSDFKWLVNHVYWLCYMYTNSLYHTPRLPITTRLADSYASTSGLKSTYVKMHKVSN